MTTAVPLGYEVREEPHALDGTVYVLGGQHLILVGTGQPEVVHARRLGRWLVRRGMADVLAWLGEEVGEEPEPNVGRYLIGALMRSGKDATMHEEKTDG